MLPNFALNRVQPGPEPGIGEVKNGIRLLDLHNLLQHIRIAVSVGWIQPNVRIGNTDLVLGRLTQINNFTIIWMLHRSSDLSSVVFVRQTDDELSRHRCDSTVHTNVVAEEENLFSLILWDVAVLHRCNLYENTELLCCVKPSKRRTAYLQVVHLVNLRTELFIVCVEIDTSIDEFL